MISIDGWAPILSAETQAQLGELKVLLAIGSESQIAQLRQQRGLEQDMIRPDLMQEKAKEEMPPPPAPPANNFSFQLRIVGAAGLPLNPGKAKKQNKRQGGAKRFPANEPPNTYVSFQAANCNSRTFNSHEGLVYATPIVQKSIEPQWLSQFRVEVSADYRTNVSASKLETLNGN